MPLCHLYVTSTASLSVSWPTHCNGWVNTIALQPLKTWPFCRIEVREHYSSSMYGSSRAMHFKYSSIQFKIENRYKKPLRIAENAEKIKNKMKWNTADLCLPWEKTSSVRNKNYERNRCNHCRWLSQLILNAKAFKLTLSYKRQRQSGKKDKYVGTLIKEQ